MLELRAGARGDGRCTVTEAPRIPVANAELHTVRDAMRELNGIVDRLERGELEKAVLTRRHKMRAVVVSVEEYARLVDGAK